MYAFDYCRVAAADEAIRALREAEDGSFLAGGMTLIPILKQRLARPTVLIDLSGIVVLGGIGEDEQGLILGALATHAEVAASPLVRRVIPGLAEMAAGIGDPQVRHRGTLGGSLANNDPVADYPAAMLALDATIRTDRRAIAADDFFTGLFETALAPDELIMAVHVPVPDLFAYRKFPNPASRYAMAGVAVAVTGKGVRVAVTGAGLSGVFRMTAMEEALAADFRPEALDAVPVPAGQMNEDLHGSAAYRAHLVTVMAKRALAAAR
ncbi:MAG: carbon monoxide dehydrogenase [Alphaproteobacteria bacterium]|jgi:carbon-monoxide dehydrogenase medium subunit|nr:carbon monoxide dehydrogenase [Alphaproteobacteria bacterium]